MKLLLLCLAILPEETLAIVSVHQSMRLNTEEELGEEEEDEEDEKKEALGEGGAEAVGVAINLRAQSSELIHPRQDLRCYVVYQAAAEDGKGAGPSRPPSTLARALLEPFPILSSLPPPPAPLPQGLISSFLFFFLSLVSLFKRLVFILSFCLAQRKKRRRRRRQEKTEKN